MATTTSPAPSVHDFLHLDSQKDLLRFSTAGSVDDGKSTLIGRLLYDTQSVYEDQVRSIEGKGTTAPGQLDFALLTDGLRAEREQGITIDVAYRYFSTPKRKFIIADTPGHEQYTRNMATGASTADASIVLIDARKGVQVQSRRHAYIASLLKVRHLLVAVNKMDLIGYDEQQFRYLENDFRKVLEQISSETGNEAKVIFVPLSALLGDNVVHRSPRMTWYTGPSLLELLESLPSAQKDREGAFRLPVQRVVRPDHTFRGFAGQIASGTVRLGDEITALPSGHNAKVVRIPTWDGDLKEASSPLSVTLVLDRELDVSRGDLIVAKSYPAIVTKRLTASIVWMHSTPLDLQRRYLLKLASRTVSTHIASIENRVNITTLKHERASTLELNHIGSIQLDLLQPLAVDSYAENRSTGAFILIDPEENSTVAAGMISSALPLAHLSNRPINIASGPVTASERQNRWGHRGGVLELSGPTWLINAVERSLFNIGAVTIRVDLESNIPLSDPQLRDLILDTSIHSGFIALVIQKQKGEQFSARVGDEEILSDTSDPGLINEVHHLLYTANILTSREGQCNVEY